MIYCIPHFCQSFTWVHQNYPSIDQVTFTTLLPDRIYMQLIKH
jgi:hypothetical protein